MSKKLVMKPTRAKLGLPMIASMVIVLCERLPPPIVNAKRLFGRNAYVDSAPIVSSATSTNSTSKRPPSARPEEDVTGLPGTESCRRSAPLGRSHAAHLSASDFGTRGISGLTGQVMADDRWARHGEGA